MRRVAVFAGAGLALAALLAAHVVYWYVPRERAVALRLRPAASATASEPLQVLASGAYDVCLWVPYPHQNLGALSGAIGDLQDVIGAAARLASGEAGEASPPRPREAEEPPPFGPFEVPPANEMVACSDLAGGRRKVAARVYPALAAVAKLAGRVAGNPWLAGGVAGTTRIAWDGRLWTVTAGAEAPRSPAMPPEAAAAAAANAAAGAAAGAAVGAAAGAAAPELPESLAVVHWTGVRPEIPAGYYALTRRGSDLSLSLIAGVAAGASAGAAASPAAAVPSVAGPGTLPSLLVAVGPDWRGAVPFGGGPPGAGSGDPGRGQAGGGSVGSGPPGSGPSGSGPSGRGSLGSGPPGSAGAATGGLGAAVAARPPAALALFEIGGSRLSTLGDLPGLAVFNAAAPGAAPGPVRWRLPTEGIFRLLAGRLPTADVAGWRILALDQGSLRQAEALAPGLAAAVPPIPAGVTVPAGVGAAAGAPPITALVPSTDGGAGLPTTAAPTASAAGAALSLGLWLEPRSTLRIVTRIRRFVEKFPLASPRQVDLWRDWETVLDPLANCDHAVLAATASPPSMRLLLQGCAAAVPR